MFNWHKREETSTTKRTIEELRRQLRTLDSERMRGIKGGQGLKVAQPILLTCGGWLPQ